MTDNLPAIVAPKTKVKRPGKIYSDTERLKVFELWLMERPSSFEISRRTGVPANTIRAWKKKYHWMEKRRQFLQDLEARYLSELGGIVRRNRPVVMRRHLTMAAKLDDAVSKTMDAATNALPPQDLSNLARAAKSSSDIAARVVGLDSTSYQESAASPSLLQYFSDVRSIREVPEEEIETIKDLSLPSSTQQQEP